MFKRTLTSILTIALLIESAGPGYIGSAASAQDSTLRPMASAIKGTALRKELVWTEGVSEASPETGPHQDKEISFFGEDSGGGITHIRFARYKGKVYRAKIVRDRVRNGEERYITPQAEILHYLNSLNISGIPKVKHFLEVQFSDGSKRRVVLFEEFEPGETLYTKMVRERNIPEAEAVDIMLKVSHIVRRMHKAGVYHWDIKPTHTWITDNGEIIIFDFDTAFMTNEEFIDRELFFAGTPLYRSQKRWQWHSLLSHDFVGEGFSPAADEVYSLGLILVDMLINMYGSVIFPGIPERWSTFRLKAMEDTGFPQGLKSIIYKAISGGRSEYESVDEFIADLEEYRRQEDAGASSPLHSKFSSAGQEMNADENLQKLFNELSRVTDSPRYINSFMVRIDFFKAGEKRRAEAILKAELKKLESNMVALLRTIFSRLSEAGNGNIIAILGEEKRASAVSTAELGKENRIFSRISSSA